MINEFKNKINMDIFRIPYSDEFENFLNLCPGSFPFHELSLFTIIDKLEMSGVAYFENAIYEEKYNNMIVDKISDRLSVFLEHNFSGANNSTAYHIWCLKYTNCKNNNSGITLYTMSGTLLDNNTCTSMFRRCANLITFS